MQIQMQLHVSRLRPQSGSECMFLMWRQMQKHLHSLGTVIGDLITNGRKEREMPSTPKNYRMEKLLWELFENM